MTQTNDLASIKSQFEPSTNRHRSLIEAGVKPNVDDCQSAVTAAKAAGSAVLVASPSELQSVEFLRKAAAMLRRLQIHPRYRYRRARIIDLPGTHDTQPRALFMKRGRQMKDWSRMSVTPAECPPVARSGGAGAFAPGQGQEVGFPVSSNTIVEPPAKRNVAGAPGAAGRRKPMSDRRRYLVLKRDRFQCQTCHKFGGELENLRTLCKKCNRGKGGDLE